MKAFSCLLIIATPLLFGCEKADQTPAPASTNAASGGVLTAPVDYLGAMGKAQQSAVKSVDTTSINSALQLFNADQGRYPKDLNELVQQKYMPAIPTPPYGTKLVYDAQAGKVTVAKE